MAGRPRRKGAEEDPIPATDYDQSARGRLRAWVAEQIEAAIAANESISTPALTTRAVEHFRTDPEFVEALMRERFTTTVYNVIVEKIGTSRRYIRHGDSATPREQFARLAEQLASRWDHWLEHTGAVSVPVLAMTKADLQAAAAERTRRGTQQFHVAALWRTLAEGLQDGERVGDRYTAEQIEQLYQSLEGEV